MAESLELVSLAPTQSSIAKSHNLEFLEIDFIFNSPRHHPYQLDRFDGIFIKNSPNLQSVTEVLTKRFLVRFFNRQASTFILKVDITDLESINPSEVQKLIEKFDKKIFLISFENSHNEEVQIFWKFQDEKIFWTRIQKEISKFFLNFLASSMRIDGHSGISANFLSNFQSTEKFFEVGKVALANSNGLNLLMIAAERGDSNAVNFLLKSGFNVNQKVNEKTAVDLAWDNQHFEVVLQLLKANSYFPRNFEVNLATDGIKKFIDVTMELQNFILDGNFHEIEKILNENPNLRHFNSIQNISAPAFALLNGKFDAYEFLVANNVYIGPDEKMQEILKQVDRKGSENLNEIHQKYLKNFKENHLMILTVNSFVGHDVPNADEKLSHVRKAFKFLDQVDPFVSLILQTVAASREFQIIFDFNRQSIQHLDPTADQQFRGMFYTSRQIYVAAADLLNPSKVLDVYGTLTHELCHYAMLLVYDNFCRPYYATEEQAMNLYTKIAAICRANRSKEELVNLVFNYSPEMHHAELIVRIPQLMVLYSNNPAKMEECRQHYADLFKFCELCVAVDMQNHLPNIKSTAEEKAQEFKRCNKRQSKILITLTITLPFAIWLAILIAKPYIEPLYSCGNLTDELRAEVLESTVDFQGVNVIFGDLFGRHSSACQNLSDQDISNIHNIFKSGKFVENYTDYRNFAAEENEEIEHIKTSDGKWKSDLRSTKGANLSYNFNQKSISDEEDLIYIKYMSTHFRVPSLKVSEKVNIRAKFYIERFMTYPDLNNSISNHKRVSFQNISSTKLLLLSDKGGSGKSTYFRHMAWKLKRRFPLKWICYFDLKQHIDVLQNAPKSDANFTTLVDFLSSKILNLTKEVEIEVFGKKFLSNDSIFLWDAVDEVSPMYTDEILRLVEIIGRLTNNKQWVSSLPHLEDTIASKLNVKSHKLEDYDEEDKKEFITNFLESEDVKNQNKSKVVEEISNFSKRLSNEANNQNPASNPQILQMICESYMRNALTGDLRNIYTLYDNHSRELFKEVYKKGAIVKDYALKIALSGEYRKIHQHFAVTSEIFLLSMNRSVYSPKEFHFGGMEITKPGRYLKDKDYLRYKIVYNMNNRTLFEHDSYKDFFIAQYLHSYIWDSDIQSPRNEEAEARLEFLFHIFDKYNSTCNIAGDFILGFIEANSDDARYPLNVVIRNFMIEKYHNLLQIVGKNVQTIELVTKFFNKDREILNKLWKIYENRTFLHHYIEKHAKDIPQIKRIIEENFDNRERKKIFGDKYHEYYP